MSVYTNAAGGTPDETAAYVRAVLDLQAGEDPLAVLRRTPGALRDRVDGLTAEQAVQPEAPGKWSIRHVLAHLADSELVWGWRLRLVLAQDRPAIAGYDQDRWAARLGYDRIAAHDALTTFSVLRAGTLPLLEHASPDDRQRVGVHAERGEESVEHMIRLYAGHDVLHLRQIDRIRDAIRA